MQVSLILESIFNISTYVFSGLKMQFYHPYLSYEATTEEITKKNSNAKRQKNLNNLYTNPSSECGIVRQWLNSPF